MLYAFNDEDAKVKTALKLVLCGPEEKVVGLHCIGPSSDEMMQARISRASPVHLPRISRASPARFPRTSRALPAHFPRTRKT